MRPLHSRYIWPKISPPLSERERAISDDWMHFWHEVLPKRYGSIEKFNHGYPLKYLPDRPHFRTIEIGAGSGGHLEFEDLSRQDYHCVEHARKYVRGNRTAVPRCERHYRLLSGQDAVCGQLL